MASFEHQVSICSDIWSTQSQQHFYMGITLHFIDNAMFLHKYVIGFRHFNQRHNALGIASMIKTVLQEYNLQHRIFSYSFDNASANTAAVNHLVEDAGQYIKTPYTHQRCACHILNLCVQDGLKVLGDMLTPIKLVIDHIWHDSDLRRKWRNLCLNKNVHPIAFSKDVGTRWNSTYKLLCEAVRYKVLLQEFASIHVPWSILDDENVWETCAHICNVLKTFNDATNTMSCVYTPTSHRFLEIAVNVSEAFVKCFNIPCLLECMLDMKEKWLKYYKNIPMIYLVTAVFDPRLKLDGLSDLLTIYYDCLCVNLTQENINVPNIVQQVNTEIGKLLSTFQSSASSSSTAPSPSPSSTSSSSSLSLAQQVFARRTKTPRHSSSNAEYQDYLNTCFNFDDNVEFDILDWWKRLAPKYPTLVKIVQQIMAVPASTVAVEQAFSRGGNILGHNRTQLKPEKLEMQVCIQDWIRAAKRKQRNAPVYDSKSDSNSEDAGTTSESDIER